MEDISDVSQFNTFVLKSFSSLNHKSNLDLLSNFPINEQSFQLLINCLYCTNQEICNENTKLITMKILTNFLESSFQPDLAEPIQKYFESLFKSIEINSRIISSPFSIDLFATVYQKTPDSASDLLNSMKDELPYEILMKYTIRFVKKVRITDGFEQILLSVFQNLSKLDILYEMITIQVIGKFLTPTFLSENIHLLLFKEFCSTDINAYKIIIYLLQFQYTHFINTAIFNDFASQCIQLYDDYLIPSFDQHPKENSELLIELRKTFSFRSIQFDAFFVNFIYKLHQIYQFAIENFSKSIECLSNLLNFFGNLNQLGCNSKSEEAKQFNEGMMTDCRSLLIQNLPKMVLSEYDENGQLDQSNSYFFEQAASLFSSDYHNSVSELLSIPSLVVFTILREMVMLHRYSDQSLYFETDILIFDAFLQSKIVIFPFFTNFLKTFFMVYPPTSGFPAELYFQSFTFAIQLLQVIEEIELKDLEDIAEIISKIEIIDEDSLRVLTSNFVFPFLEKSYDKYSDTMIKIYKKLSELSFYDEIMQNMLENPEISPDIKILSSSQSSLEFIFNVLIQKIPEFVNEQATPVVIATFSLNLLKRIIEMDYPYMSSDLIIMIRSICDILSQLILIPDSFDIQLIVVKALTVIFQARQVNLDIFLYYNDYFFITLTTNLFDSLIQLQIEPKLENFNVFLDFYALIINSVDEISPLILPDSSILFYLNYLTSINLNEIDDLSRIFNIVLGFFKSNRIDSSIDGLTDSLLDNCLKRGSIQKGALQNLYLTIPYLLNLHRDTLNRFIQKQILDEDDLNLIFNGNESESITVIKSLCALYSCSENK